MYFLKQLKSYERQSQMMKVISCWFLDLTQTSSFITTHVAKSIQHATQTDLDSRTPGRGATSGKLLFVKSLPFGVSNYFNAPNND